MSVYLESSAAAKLLVSEAETAALTRYLDKQSDKGIAIVSGFILETELRRLAVRLDLDQLVVSNLLDRLDLYEADRATFTEAGLLPGKNLRSLDALHIAMAIRVAAPEMITYDQRQADSAMAVGLRVIAPD
ncbi:MAG: type II toxin-antitoxin system VapC family toxin [Sciscionella sp.]|nr:type II toxin-antitoxin system VapC family toxin [Sciscionella sp.]